MPADRPLTHTSRFRVRYSETDQMGTFYNSRALEWFEVGRTELLRAVGRPGQAGGYARMEAAGLMLPLVEAHVEYLGRAGYDDELEMTVTAHMTGRARVRFDVRILHADSAAEVTGGYTVHAVTDLAGKPTRPPAWFAKALCGPPEGKDNLPSGDC